MAVQVMNGGGGLFGVLGPLAALGGALIPGAGWLTPVGAGMSAMGSAMSGNPQGALGSVLSGIANGDFGGWTNPAAGNIAKPEDTATAEELMKKWGAAIRDPRIVCGGF